MSKLNTATIVAIQNYLNKLEAIEQPDYTIEKLMAFLDGVRCAFGAINFRLYCERQPDCSRKYSVVVINCDVKTSTITSDNIECY